MEGSKEKPYLTLFNFSKRFNVKLQHWSEILKFTAPNILLNQKIYCAFDIYFFKKTSLMDQTGQSKKKKSIT